MPDTPPECTSSRRVYDGRLVKVDLDTVRPSNGREFELEVVRHPGAAAVIPLLSDPQGEDPSVLLLEQYRYATGTTIWEVPAGVLEPGEDPESCARRELLEETGAEAAQVEYLTTVYTTPGFTDERIHLFVATGITVGEPNHERDEFIQVRARPLSEVLRMIRDGEIVDGKTIVAILYAAGFRLGM
jgi:ADP-ribose pyrophosphatase